MSSFWNSVIYILKVTTPLVIVLRIIDNENEPTMGSIYAALGDANELNEKYFYFNSSKFIDMFVINDKRYECQPHHPLHVVSYHLNPEYSFIKNDKLRVIQNL